MNLKSVLSVSFLFIWCVPIFYLQPGMDAVNSEYLMEAHAITTNTSFCKQHFPLNYEYLFLCTYGLRNAKTLEAVIRNRKENMTSSSTSNKTTHVIPSITVNSTTPESKNTTAFEYYSTWRCGEKKFSPNNTPEEVSIKKKISF